MIIDRSEFILLILSIIILGALLHRKWYAVGNAVTITAITIYLIIDSGRTIKRIVRFRGSSPSNRVRVVMWFALLFVTISVWRGGNLSYLFLLILLAVDYMMTTNPRKK